MELLETLTIIASILLIAFIPVLAFRWYKAYIKRGDYIIAAAVDTTIGIFATTLFLLANS